MIKTLGVMAIAVFFSTSAQAYSNTDAVLCCEDLRTIELYYGFDYQTEPLSALTILHAQCEQVAYLSADDLPDTESQ